MIIPQQEIAGGNTIGNNLPNSGNKKEHFNCNFLHLQLLNAVIEYVYAAWDKGISCGKMR